MNKFLVCLLALPLVLLSACGSSQATCAPSDQQCIAQSSGGMLDGHGDAVVAGLAGYWLGHRNTANQVPQYSRPAIYRTYTAPSRPFYQSSYTPSTRSSFSNRPSSFGGGFRSSSSFGRSSFGGRR